MDDYGKQALRLIASAAVAWFVAWVLRAIGAGKFVTNAVSGAAGGLAAAYVI
jgi:hypothetical protein